ncbi:MAG: hypothetical protein OEZ29_04820, partial [Candidatus Bathyarchaeota archaeon]|nr:hypothetical protein [Candidatus Bathyarchaeota archaeon]
PKAHHFFAFFTGLKRPAAQQTKRVHTEVGESENAHMNKKSGVMRCGRGDWNPGLKAWKAYTKNCVLNQAKPRLQIGRFSTLLVSFNFRNLNRVRGL